MRSLRTKITCLIVAVLILAVGATTWHDLRTAQKMARNFAVRHTQALSATISSSIVAAMSIGAHEDAFAALENISAQPSVEAVRIFDEQGRIAFSTAQQRWSESATEKALSAYRSGLLTYLEDGSEGPVYSALTTIPNSSACHDCHQQESPVLGIIQIQVPLTDFRSEQVIAAKATLFSALGMLCVLIAAISSFIQIYVNRPINSLVTGMKRLEDGDFTCSLPLMCSSQEMEELSGAFNRMVKRLDVLVKKTLRHEKELIVQEQMLAHHNEISRMNETLEERLHEIENLNINLEERIEEIEEANFKIADLAGELEDKNRNLGVAVNRLSFLYEMGLNINATMDLKRLFDLLVRRTMKAVNARYGYILLHDEDSESLQVGCAVGVPADIEPGMRIPLCAGGASHWVMENGRALLISDMEAAESFNKTSLLGLTRETLVCAPLVVHDEIIGTITMANRHDAAPYRQEELELVSTIAAQASVAIKNARLYADQERLYLSMVHALVSAIEASDAYTRGHSERVTRYSLAIARFFGLPPASMKDLEQAAILHDIGKIGIDGHLLCKAEALSADDVERLHRHPLIGVQILEPIDFLSRVRAIIGQHHERFDGAGYPFGICGDELCLEARILAVADTYDAMTSNRPYRDGMSAESALQEINRNAGTQFDPQVVQAFGEVYHQGLLNAAPQDYHLFAARR